jgi:hypothetical protein
VTKKPTHRVVTGDFPNEDEPAVATPATTQRWFVTCHSTEKRKVRDAYVEWPRSLAHAKRMGSTSTACGIPAWSWPKLFHVSFPPVRTDVCPDCVAAIARQHERR